MRSKLDYLTGISLKRKIKTKWFLFANIALAIVMIALFNIDSIITYFGGDFNEKQKVYIVDNTNESFDLFDEQLKVTSEALYGEDNSSYEVEKIDKTEEEAKKLLNEDDESKNIVIIFNPSLNNVIEFDMISKEYMDLVDTQLLTAALNNTKIALALSKTTIDQKELNKIYSTAVINRTYLDEEKNSADENMDMIMSTVFPIIILPFFMLTIFLVQMIGAEVNDEKTTRSMEIIIANVPPKTHFFAKVIAGNLFVIIQGILLFSYAGIGLLISHLIGNSSITGGITSQMQGVVDTVLSSNFGNTLYLVLPLTLVLMLLTFLGYSLLAGILASMTTNIEDFQQMQAPIIVISLIGYYLSMMAGLFEGATFIKVLSFVPLISAILSPSLLVLGQIGIVEISISILLVVLFDYLLIKYGLKIYKVGILNYSSKDLWKKVFKAIKN
ncbi:MAG: hypothetical protein PHD02_03355 [Bacilli bacterium]|nr:hypothetical protein [Bacilli bacterium]